MKSAFSFACSASNSVGSSDAIPKKPDFRVTEYEPDKKMSAARAKVLSTEHLLKVVVRIHLASGSLAERRLQKRL